MALRNGDRARFNRRNKKFASNRARIRAFRATLATQKNAEPAAVVPPKPVSS